MRQRLVGVFEAPAEQAARILGNNRRLRRRDVVEGGDLLQGTIGVECLLEPAEDGGIRLVVFDFSIDGALGRVLAGERVGTLVDGG